MRRSALALVALLALAGCGEQQVCTLIGCHESAAAVRFAGLPRGAVEIRVCADGRCHDAVLMEQTSSTVVPLDHELRERSRLLVEVRRRGRVIARAAAEVPVTTSRPNGPDCPPVCRTAAARLDLDTGRLEAS